MVNKLQLGDRVGGRVYVCYVRELEETVEGVRRYLRFSTESWEQREAKGRVVV